MTSPASIEKYGSVSSVPGIENANVYFREKTVEFNGTVDEKQITWIDTDRDFTIDQGDTINGQVVGKDYDESAYTGFEGQYSKMEKYVNNIRFFMDQMEKVVASDDFRNKDFSKQDTRFSNLSCPNAGKVTIKDGLLVPAQSSIYSRVCSLTASQNIFSIRAQTTEQLDPASPLSVVGFSGASALFPITLYQFVVDDNATEHKQAETIYDALNQKCLKKN